MQPNTRVLFNRYVGQLAQLNDLPADFTAIPGELKQFAVAPVIEQKLQAKLTLTSDFMSRINVVPVVEQQGSRVGVGISRSLASRTNRAAGNAPCSASFVAAASCAAARARMRHGSASAVARPRSHGCTRKGAVTGHRPALERYDMPGAS